LKATGAPNERSRSGEAGGSAELLAVQLAKRGCKLVYANGIYVQHTDGFGVDIFGSNGEIKVNRGKFVLIVDGKTIAEFTDVQKKEGKIQCSDEVKKAELAFLQNPKIQLYKSKNHIDDFMECLKSRKKPITSEIVGAHSAICCHLMNLAYKYGQTIKWDPAKEEFVGDKEANQWLDRPKRGPWKV